MQPVELQQFQLQSLKLEFLPKGGRTKAHGDIAMDLRSLGKRVESNIGFGSVGNSTTQNWSRTASSTGTAKVLVGRDITLHQNVIFSGVAVTVDIDGQRVVCTIDGEGSNRSLLAFLLRWGVHASKGPS